MAATSRMASRRPAKRQPQPVLHRERRLIRLGYRALAIGVNHAHLGSTWISHFGAKSQRFFDLANQEWLKHA